MVEEVEGTGRKVKVGPSHVEGDEAFAEDEVVGRTGEVVGLRNRNWSAEIWWYMSCSLPLGLSSN